MGGRRRGRPCTALPRGRSIREGSSDGQQHTPRGAAHPMPWGAAVTFSLADFVKHRPWLYHLTAAANVEGIRPRGELLSAGRIFTEGAVPHRRSEHRPDAVQVPIGRDVITVCDQAPLYAGNIALAPDFTFEDLLKLLNGFVFFWPGGEDGPMTPGRNHFERYRQSRPSVLRIPSGHLADSGPSPAPLFSRYNTGAPRFSRGQASPRGPDVFKSHDRFEGTLSDVVEVGFSFSLPLPATTEFSIEPFSAWRPMFMGSLLAGGRAPETTKT